MNLERHWREFREGHPGYRFQERFERNQRSRAAKTWPSRLLQPAAAMVLLLLGVVLIFIPGPAVLFFFAGASLLASESRTVARFLDWLEVSLRKGISWVARWWKQAPRIAKHSVILLAALVIISAGYGAYQIVFGR